MKLAIEIIVILAIVGIAVYAVVDYRKKLNSGCCDTGPSETVKKIKPKDTKKSHYPYHVTLDIDGMSCENCSTKVSNALNRLDDTYAVVSHTANKAEVYQKHEIDESALRTAVREAGYTVMGVRA